MILTCPACGTNYVVKDSAIPPAGRQVRCASCKHSWHQGPATREDESVLVGQEIGISEPSPAIGAGEDLTAQPPAEAEAEAENMIVQEPQSATKAETEPQSAFDAPSEPLSAGLAEPSAEDRHSDVDSQQQFAAGEDEFVGYAPMQEEEERRPRRWPYLVVGILLIVAAAVGFWFYAPAEWKARAGIADSGATPLQLMITTRDRQRLESGNDLVAISGRVINPTDREQNVPPIRAELRNSQTRKLVHRWTIAPPAQVLAPRSSASFNSAEVDVPSGGDELTVTLGG